MKTKFVLPVVLLAFVSAAAVANATPIVSDPNLLSGLAATPGDANSSSVYESDYALAYATNGLAGGAGDDFVFAAADGDQRVAITGFNSDIDTIRIWSTDLRPLQVTIDSSTTSTTSITAGDYGTTLVPLTTLASLWTDAGGNLAYADFSVTAPVGTQSLFFDFGAKNNTSNDAGFARIGELQAFAPVPEPASLALLGLGAVGLLAMTRRRS